MSVLQGRTPEERVRITMRKHDEIMRSKFLDIRNRALVFANTNVTALTETELQTMEHIVKELDRLAVGRANA